MYQAKPIDSLIDRYRETSNDSLKLKLAFKISYKYYLENDSLPFRKWNERSFELARKEQNVYKTAEAHWDLGNFFYRQTVNDSSYAHFYRAYQLFMEVDSTYYAARMLLNMGVVQESVKDYIGSETTTVRALQILEPLRKHKQLYLAYTNMGIVENGLENYENAISFHQKALKQLEELQDSILMATSYNNIGVVYQEQGKYEESVAYFQKVLKIKNLEQDNPRLYAMALDNLALNYFLSGTTSEDYRGMSEKALKIREEIQHISGIATNKIHFAKYAIAADSASKAIRLLKEARDQAVQYHDFMYVLESLKELGAVDTLHSKQHLERYIQLNDSLVKEERLIRNKFARVRYETDEYIQKAEFLSEQRGWFIAGAIVLAVIFLLIYYLREQRSRNKELVFEKEQQEANARIYELLYSQQEKLEQAKNMEKNRIASELHDGVLGKLFGLRMSLGIIREDSKTLLPPKGLERFGSYLDELQGLEKEIRSISHEMVNEINSSQSSFSEILQNLVAEKQALTSTKMLLIDENIDWENWPNEVKVHIYRIIQEAIQNCIRHAEAHKMNIQLSENKNGLKITLQDDGRGFLQQKEKKGIGLRNIHQRVTKLHGHWNIASNNGTTLVIEIPSENGKYISHIHS